MKKLIILLCLLPLTACQHPGQNRYGWQDVGQATTVEFGTIVSLRTVQITGRNTGAGAAIGASAGAVGGSYIGSGSGSLAGALAGAIVAGIAGAAVEQAAADRQGMEYIVTLENGTTKSIVQNIVDGDELLELGDRVIVQTSGMYQRILPAGDLPETVKRPKKIKVVD